MDLCYLKEFVSLAEMRSFSKVSENLNTSASSASRHIQALENEIGIQLVDRNPKGIELTEYGEIFLPYVKQIIQAEQQGLREIEDRRNLEKNKLIIGASGNYAISELLAHFYLQDQDTDISFKEYPADSLTELLALGICELAFCDRRLVNEQQMVSVPYRLFHYSIVLPKSHPLADKSSVTLYDLEEERIILEDEEDYQNNLLKEIFEEAGFVPKHLMYIGRAAKIFMHYNVGINITLSDNDNSDGRGNIVKIPLRPERNVEIVVCYLRNNNLSRGAQRFINYLLKQWPKDKIAMKWRG
jgi:DNA-binding transcriptional LysR family regulator